MLKRALVIPAVLLVLAAACLAVPVDSKSQPEPVKAKGFSGRGAAMKQKLVKQEGGNDKSEAAVAAGLKWLSLHQAADGRFSLHNFAADANCKCDGRGKVNDYAGTGLALLAFLGAGETHKTKRGYTRVVENGLRLLIANQGKGLIMRDKGMAIQELGTMDGNLGEGYAHAINTIALCEAYAMTGDAWLKGPAQKAVDCCVAWQSKDGGFRYQPRMAGDTSVTGWHMQALRAAEVAGLKIPRATWQGIDAWFKTVSNEDGSQFGYNQENKEAAPAVTAIGLLHRLNRGVSPKDAGLVKGTNFLATRYAPKANRAGNAFQFSNIYYFYYANQVMHRMGGPTWEKWNPQLREMLIKTQDSSATHKKGSWWPLAKDNRPVDAWLQLGRPGHTALAILILEEYYR